MVHHRKIAPSANSSCCGDQEETFLHCVHDCRFSSIIWNKIGFSGSDFFSTTSPHDWIKNGFKGPCPSISLAGLWWIWRHRNMMCLNNEVWFISFKQQHSELSQNNYSKSSMLLLPKPIILLSGIAATMSIPFSMLTVAASELLAMPILVVFSVTTRDFISGFSGYISLTLTTSFWPSSLIFVWDCN